jgi:steroid 5-alpha reductase family enzyme
MSGVGSTVAISAAALFVFMLVTWVASLRLRDVSIVDVAWGIGFVLVAFFCFALGDGAAERVALVTAMTVVWGVRLAFYIGRRKLRHPGEDARYTEIRDRYGDRFPLVSLYWVFLLQGALVLLVSLPIHAAAGSFDPLGPLDYAGVAVYAVGLFFEAVGDAQLGRFKADPSNRGKVMDRGLWRYTRHPNYFGELLIWWGLYLIALSGGGWWTIVSPLVMSVLLLRVSGKDRLERSLSERPGYREYVERTSGFVPLPPRGS